MRVHGQTLTALEVQHACLTQNIRDPHENISYTIHKLKYLNMSFVIVVPILFSLGDQTQRLKQEHISFSTKASIPSTIMGIS